MTNDKKKIADKKFIYYNFTPVQRARNRKDAETLITSFNETLRKKFDQDAEIIIDYFRREYFAPRWIGNISFFFFFFFFVLVIC